MSWENTHCPCGGKKLTETMLCDSCESALADTFDRRRMDDATASWQERRNAAIRVLACSRQRRKLPPLPLAYSAS